MERKADKLLETVRHYVLRYQLLTEGEPVVIGVSGGADSLCLLHVLLRLMADSGTHLHVAHLNHSIRGSEAAADAAFVTETAICWGLRHSVERIDVPALAARSGLAIEEAARQARYSFLARVARREGAQTVAVGHSADDQSETVLMHWLRGAGVAGLRGMLPATPMKGLRLFSLMGAESPDLEGMWLVRPLLAVKRTVIEEYCRAHNLQPRFDRSNLDTTIYRNRLRHNLLPLLESYNPRIRDILWRSATTIADDYDFLQAELRKTWAHLVLLEEEQAIVFDLATWRALPPSLQRSTLREAVRRLRSGLRNINWAHIEAGLWLARENSTGAQATLPQGLLLTLGYDSLLIRDSRWERPSAHLPLLHVEELRVLVPGTTTLPQTAWQLVAELRSPSKLPSGWRENTDRWQVFLDSEVVSEKLSLRRRLPGDRFQPFGMRGRSVKLADYMINAKIPRDIRDRWPLLVAGDGIQWVVGHRQDERTQVTPDTGRVLHVQVRRFRDGPLCRA
jgi:tRNA(Ile)-lysidine synthetase-like protein